MNPPLIGVLRNLHLSKLQELTLGVTKGSKCSYLPDESERLLVVYPNSQLSSSTYQQLMAQGFRRGGNDAYRPHCEDCNACQSIRVNVSGFLPSKNQKRVINKNKKLTFKWTSTPTTDYFELYSQYITHRHQNGSMFPPSRDALNTFTQCDWLDIYFLESYIDDELVSVAVCDLLGDGLSAVYTFFSPEHDANSLGRFSILKQIQQCHALGLEYLYMGFQIDACDAMNYKKQYLPNERYIDNQWIKYKK